MSIRIENQGFIAEEKLASSTASPTKFRMPAIEELTALEQMAARFRMPAMDELTNLEEIAARFRMPAMEELRALEETASSARSHMPVSRELEGLTQVSQKNLRDKSPAISIVLSSLPAMPTDSAVQSVHQKSKRILMAKLTKEIAWAYIEKEASVEITTENFCEIADEALSHAKIKFVSYLSKYAPEQKNSEKEKYLREESSKLLICWNILLQEMDISYRQDALNKLTGPLLSLLERLEKQPNLAADQQKLTNIAEYLNNRSLSLLAEECPPQQKELYQITEELTALVMELSTVTVGTSWSNWSEIKKKLRNCETSFNVLTEKYEQVDSKRLTDIIKELNDFFDKWTESAPQIPKVELLKRLNRDVGKFLLMVPEEIPHNLQLNELRKAGQVLMELLKQIEVVDIFSSQEQLQHIKEILKNLIESYPNSKNLRLKREELCEQGKLSMRNFLNTFEEKQFFFTKIEIALRFLELALEPYIQECLVILQQSEEETYAVKDMDPKMDFMLRAFCGVLDEYLSTCSGHLRCNRVPIYEFYVALSSGIAQKIPKDILMQAIKMQVLTREINHDLYLKKVDCLIKNNSELIVRNLFPKISSDQWIKSIGIIPEEGETHNGGQVACRVTFKDSLESYKFYYKPRTADMDIAIIDLFAKLNASNSERAAEKTLTTFKIFNLPNHEGSVWQFIEGKHPIDEQNPSIHTLADMIVQEQTKDPPKAEVMKSQLDLLEGVCQAAGIKDLHYANVLVNDEGKVFLIDLECLVEPNSEGTGLSAHSITPSPLTDNELAIIKEFRESVINLKIQNRIVPRATHLLLGKMVSLAAVRSLAMQAVPILREIVSEEYVILKRFFSKILLDNYISCDVPYFIEVGSSVYLNEAKFENRVAAKNEE